MEFFQSTKKVLAARWEGHDLQDAQRFIRINKLPDEIEYGLIKGEPCLVVPTRFGAHIARRFDWIVELSNGRYRVCKSREFTNDYQPSLKLTAA